MIKPPRLIAWELTCACNLKCIHCRGSATEKPDTDELTLGEAKHFIDELVDYGKPILILTGGEPLVREDVFEIAQHGTDRGLRVVLATNGTLVTQKVAHKMREAGIKRVSVSIDGSSAEIHDRFRGMPGSFEASLHGIDEIKKAGIEFQVNTTITRHNIKEVTKIYDFALSIGAKALHIFMLVPTGRGNAIEGDEIPPDEYEHVLNWVYDINYLSNSQIQVKATCAPHYFRIMRKRAKAEGIKITAQTHGFEAVTKGCLGGTGFCFVSHTGEVCPCGFLPVIAGNIRETQFMKIWEQSKIFNDLRDVNKLKGKCRICEYRRVCSGCRARAFAETGDYLAEEPYCTYIPEKKLSSNDK